MIVNDYSNLQVFLGIFNYSIINRKRICPIDYDLKQKGNRLGRFPFECISLSDYFLGAFFSTSTTNFHHF